LIINLLLFINQLVRVVRKKNSWKGNNHNKKYIN
jgi:hypothetical protein